MAYPIFADSIGGVGQQLANQRSQQIAEQQFREQILANLMARRQQQGQFDAGQVMQRQAMEQSARENALARALQMRRFNEVELPQIAMWQADQRRPQAPPPMTADAVRAEIQAAQQQSDLGNYIPTDAGVSPFLRSSLNANAARVNEEVDRMASVENTRRRLQAEKEGRTRSQASIPWWSRMNPINSLAALFGGGLRNYEQPRLNEIDQELAALERATPEQREALRSLTETLPKTGLSARRNRNIPMPAMTQTNQAPVMIDGETGQVVSPTNRNLPTNTPAGKSKTTLRVLDRESGVKLLKLANGDVQKAADLADWLGFGDPVE